VAEKVGGVYIEIQARMGSLEKDLRDLQLRMQNVDKTGSQLSGTMSKFGAYISGGVIAAGIFNIGKSALSAAANMEQQRVAFTTMLGSAEKAKTLLTEMQNFAASTPFQFDEIVTAGKQMIAFGFESGAVIDNLRMLGDVAAGLSQPVGDMVYLFGQIKTQGRAMTQDLMQFANRGVPIYDELAKVLGVDVSQVKEFASQGKIGFKEIEQVFKNLTQEGGKFAGLMDAQSKTLAGRWSNFNDQLDKTLVLMGEEIAPTAGTILDFVNNILNIGISNTQSTNEWASRLSTVADIALTVVSPIKAAWEYSIWALEKLNEILGTTSAQAEEQKKTANVTKQNAAEEKKQIVSTVKAGKDKWKALKDEAKKYYDTVRGIATGTDDPVKQVENEIAALDVGMTRTEWLYEKGKISKQQYENTLASYTEARIKKEEELEQAKFDRMREYYNLGVSTLTGFSGQINELASMYASNQTTRIEQEAQKRTDALNAEYENQVAIIEASAASDSQKAEQKKALDEQLARDTKAISDKAEKDKRKAQRESAKISKQLAIFDTLITTPQAAIDSYTSLAKIPFVGPALGAAAAAAATALGLAKLKLIQDQPLPALAEGGIVPAIPGGRQITVAEGGNSEGVIPFNERGVDILAQAMEKAISKIGGTNGTTNVYIDSELIYSNMYEASRRGAVKIDQRAIV
jgi:tape measure domain-containing protein